MLDKSSGVHGPDHWRAPGDSQDPIRVAAGQSEDLSQLTGREGHNSSVYHVVPRAKHQQHEIID